MTAYEQQIVTQLQSYVSELLQLLLPVLTIFLLMLISIFLLMEEHVAVSKL